MADRKGKYFYRNATTKGGVVKCAVNDYCEVEKDTKMNR